LPPARAAVLPSASRGTIPGGRAAAGRDVRLKTIVRLRPSPRKRETGPHDLDSPPPCPRRGHGAAGCRAEPGMTDGRAADPASSWGGRPNRGCACQIARRPSNRRPGRLDAAGITN